MRSKTAPSQEEKLMCLSRAYALDTKGRQVKTELHMAVQELLRQEPFLAYVYETPDLYQVRSGRDLLVNIPKNRAFDPPYLQRDPGPLRPAFHWLYLSIIALLLGGVLAVLLAPITIFQVLRLRSMPQRQGDHVRLWVILILAMLIWLISIPIAWLLLIRLFPS